MRSTLRAVTAVTVLGSFLAGAYTAQAGSGPSLVVTPPSSITANAPFSVTARVLDANGNTIATNTDRLYISVNRVGAQSLLTTNGVATFNGLRASSTPVTLVVTDPSRNLSKTVVVPAGSPPSLTAPAGATFHVGTPGSVSVSASGNPTPRFTLSAPPGSAALPSGVTFTDNLNGTGSIAGTPASGTAGTYTATLVATNGVQPNAQQTFTLTVTGNGPTIRVFSPQAAPAGARLTINGTGFTGATLVTFAGSGTHTASPTVVSDTEVVCLVPAGAASGTLSVTTPGGTGVSTRSFTFLDLPTISIQSSTGSSGDIDFRYVVTQAEAAPVDVVFEFDASGGNFVGGPFPRCTQAPATPGAEPSGVTGVSTLASGATHHFLWDSTTDLYNTNNASVAVRARAVVHGAPGASSSAVTIAVNDVGVRPLRKLEAAGLVGPAGTAIFQSVLADVNGDDKLDLVSATLGGFQVSFGAGDGSFVSPPVNYAFNCNGGIALADMDGDGFLDVVVIANAPSGISVFHNDGAGHFTNAPVVSTVVSGNVQNGTMALVDMNGDGLLDVVALSVDGSFHGDALLVFPGLTGGKFGAPTSVGVQIDGINGAPNAHNASQFVVADLNGDGIPDVVVGFATGGVPPTSNSVGVLIGKGDGTFLATVYYAAGINPAGVAVADFDNDGFLDIATANGGALGGQDCVTILHGTGTGTFHNSQPIDLSTGLPGSSPGSYSPTLAIQAVDLNGDGIPDLALVFQVTPNPGVITILNTSALGNGTYGAFVQEPGYYPLGPNSVFIASGDMDGDGVQDIAVPCAGNGSIYTFLGRGDGTLRHKLVSQPLNVISDSVLADMNGDGKADVVTCGTDDQSRQYVTVALSNGNGTFATPVRYFVGQQAFAPTDPAPVRIAIGDIDHDGRMDIVALSATNTIIVLLQQGDGSFARQTPITVGTANSANDEITVADLNKDGLPDVIVTFSGSQLSDNGVQVLLNNSSPGVVSLTLAGSATYSTGGQYPLRAAVGVLNGSLPGTGFPDFIVPSTGPTKVFLNNGDGTFTPAATQPSVTRALALADFNNDGKLDLLADYDATHIAVYFGNGDGTFSSAPLLLDTLTVGGVVPGDVAAADLDGDGNMDIIASGSGMCVLYGDGAGHFGAPVQYGTGTAPGVAPLHITVGDVNGDGLPDVGIVTFGEGGLNVYLGKK